MNNHAIDDTKTRNEAAKISIKTLAEQCEVSAGTVHAALSFYNNSEKSIEIRKKYVEMLKSRLAYFESKGVV